jgi:hypothetical protein
LAKVDFATPNLFFGFPHPVPSQKKEKSELSKPGAEVNNQSPEPGAKSQEPEVKN